MGEIARRARGQWPLACVLLVVAVSFVALAIWPQHWRRDTGIMAVGLLAAGLLRAVLPTARAGLLAVRGRWLDTAMLVALGVFILIVDIRLT